MDFIDGLPKSKGKSFICGVEPFLKVCAFYPYCPPVNRNEWHTFFEQIFHCHGLLESIKSDREVIFTSKFWLELFQLSRTKLDPPSTYYPQSDGQTKKVNRIIEMYLRLRGITQMSGFVQFPGLNTVVI